MRINFDERLDKDYPEPSECEVNDRNCEYDVHSVCHECGIPMCEACSVGIRHQPQLSKYSYTKKNQTDRRQQHCPDCMQGHTLSGRNLVVGGGGLFIGLLFIILGGTNSLFLTSLGLLLLLTVGIGFLRLEYRLKHRENQRYGIISMW